MNEMDHAILAFEQEWYRHAGTKERVIKDRFGLSPARYYQRLNRLLDDPEALAQRPALVKRLLRQRDERQRRRTSARTRSRDPGAQAS